MTPEQDLALRILTVRPAVIERVRALRRLAPDEQLPYKIKEAHVALDALGAAWDGLIRPHDAADMGRWGQYVVEAETLVRSDPKLVPEPEGGWTVEKANNLSGTFTPDKQ